MSEIALLDGGLGQEINKRATSDKSHPLWSVKVMDDEPQIVIDVHKDFINAGARTISVNSYTITQSRLDRNGHSERYDDFHQMAISMVTQAVAQSNIARDEVTIAGCLPPIAASYVAEEALDYQSSYDEYARIIAAQGPYVDLFLVETMSNIAETKAAVAALRDNGHKAYIGLTLNDDATNTLRSGERLEQAIDELGAEGVSALSINCCYPEAIDKAMPLLGKSGLRVGGYANGFTSITALRPGQTVDNLTARRDLDPQSYANHIDRWIDDGATIIGGCCEIGPQHIAYLREHLIRQGHSITKLA